MKSVTVFTPTYNRAYILPRLYNSLCRQTSKDFIWLIVDDGSTDNTETLIKEWSKEQKVEIEYYKQSNGGKMRAHNYGVQLTKTELFVCVDSDDYLTDVAVEHILSFWKTEWKNDPTISGIIGYKSFIKYDGDSPFIKCKFPSLERESLRGMYRKGFKGDTTLIYRTGIIRTYPFPVVEGEKFITEATAYEQIDVKYKMIPCDEAFTICQYLEDGYTQNVNALKLKYPKGWAFYFNQQYKLWASELSFREKLRSLMMYIIMSKIANNKYIFRNANDKSYRYAIAFLLAVFYKNRILKS